MIFERFGDARFRPPGDYPAESLATFNTHDLPTFRGWMTGQDLASKRDIGFDPGETEEARNRSRKGMTEMLATYCGHNGPEHFAAVAGFLAATGSRLVMVQIDDLLDVAEQINIPGTVHEYPNWRRKLPIAIENWATQPIFRSTVEAFDYSGRSRRR
jgi:4-alpha-glucanotransferase